MSLSDDKSGAERSSPEGLLRPVGGFSQAVAAVGSTETTTYAELTQDAVGLAGRAAPGAGREILVLCEDRYWLSVALLAAWQAGLTVALPPNHQEKTVAALSRHREKSEIWQDGVTGPGVDIRGLVRPRGTDAGSSLTALPPERRLVTLYTSGTTDDSAAWPKVARQLLGEARMQVEHFGVSSADRVLCTVPSRHIYGLLFGVLLPLACGGTFIRETELLAQGVASKARLLDATLLVSTPAHLRAIAALEPGALGKITRIISSGAPLSATIARELVERFRVRVTEVFGSTETGGIATRAADQQGAWQPLPGVDVGVDDVGRLVVRSSYLEDPTRAHTSNDRVELCDGGGFEHLGRDDGVVKVGGKRVKLDEIEARALELDGVLDAAVLAEPVAGLRATEIRLAVVAPGWSGEGVRRALGDYFDAAVVPRQVRVLDRLPRTETGKLRRRDLRSLFDAPVGPEAPRSALGTPD